MADSASWGEIAARIAEARHAIETLGMEARERTWLVEQHGLVLGTGKDKLYAHDWAAPKTHPVWADDLRAETHRLRSMGEPIINGRPWNQKQPWEADWERWPPSFHAAEIVDKAEQLQQRLEAKQTQPQQTEATRDQGMSR